jgi:hypothetical protein
MFWVKSRMFLLLGPQKMGANEITPKKLLEILALSH